MDIKKIQINRRSANITEGKSRAPNRSMYYGMGYRGSMQPKLGIALDDEKVDVVKNGRTYSSYKNMIWVWAHNCDVVNPAPDAEYAVKTALSRTESYMRSLKSYIERTAKSFGVKNGWNGDGNYRSARNTLRSFEYCWQNFFIGL